jgi:hypothetical protein
MAAIQIELMMSDRIEELNPMASLPSIALDRYITTQYRHLSVINALSDIGVRSRRVGRQRIYPLACISLHIPRLGATGA